MKKLRYLLLLIILIPTTALAQSASISASNTVENGKSVTATLTLSNTASWNVTFSGSGATSGCSVTDADSPTGYNTTKKYSITCKATSVGTITFKATGEMTDQNYNNSTISTSKSVTVVNAKNGNTNLKSLSVSTGSINFSSGTTSYSMTVENSVTSVTISASAQESTSTVSGTGTKSLNVYGNTFNVVCRAENGSTKTYTINITRKDENGSDHVLSTENHLSALTIENYPIIFNADTTEYTILVKDTNLLNVTATGVDGKSTVTVNNVEEMVNGNNIITIDVKAENGDVKTYTINAILLDESATKKCECPEVTKENKIHKPIIIMLSIVIALLMILLFSYMSYVNRNKINMSKEEKENKKAEKKEKKASKKSKSKKKTKKKDNDEDEK